MKETQFQRYAQRLCIEAILKSLLLGIGSGACAAFVAAAVTWFTVGKGHVGLVLAICLGVFFVATLAGTLLFYFLRLRPTERQIAHRMDRLGLEERMITMIELKDEESYIAEVQREDALGEVQKVSPKQLKIRLPRKLLIAMAIALFFGAGMTVVSTLSAAGYVYSGYEVMDAVIPEEPPVYVNVLYQAVEGGLVEGEFDQRIVLGESTSEVLAVADDGFEFVMWSDGMKEPARADFNVKGDMEITALFQYVGEPQDSENGDPSEDEDAQKPKSQDQQNNADTSKDPSPDQSSAKYDPYNQIIDGQTFFKDVLQQYKDAALEDMENSGEEDKEGNGIADAYYNIIN